MRRNKTDSGKVAAPAGKRWNSASAALFSACGLTTTELRNRCARAVQASVLSEKNEGRDTENLDKESIVF